jgi:hypothetical protein
MKGIVNKFSSHNVTTSLQTNQLKHRWINEINDHIITTVIRRRYTGIRTYGKSKQTVAKNGQRSGLKIIKKRSRASADHPRRHRWPRRDSGEGENRAEAGDAAVLDGRLGGGHWRGGHRALRRRHGRGRHSHRSGPAWGLCCGGHGKKASTVR